MPLNLDNSGEFSEKIYLPNGNYRAEVTAYRNDEMLFATAAASFAVEAQSGPFTAELEREKDLPVEGPVRICFSMPVDPQTLDGIRMLDKDGTEIAAAVRFPAEDETGCTLELTPEEPLEYGTAYQVSLPVTVKDILGNGLETAELTFWTVADRTEQLLDSPDGEVEISLNCTWYFAIDPDQRGERERWYELSDEAGWDMLPVPGNWDTETEYANYKGTAWYRRSFQVPEDYAGYAVYLELTSVYYDCTVWINGQKAGYHTGGYTTFQFPVEQYLNFGGENVIAIMTSNASYEQPGDWGDGAWWKWGGISGGALLRVNNDLKLDWQHITSVPSLDEENHPESAMLTMDYRIRSRGNAAGTYYLVSQVFRRESGEPVGEAAITQVTFSGGEETCKYSAAITLEGEDVHLWHFDDPYLYLVRTELRNEAGQVVHAVEDNIGIREIRLDESTFYLNGEPLRMTGANRVGDDRVNGHTEPDYVIMRDIDYMKSMGMNCARVSHIPMSKNMLDYCDEVGFLLICEGGMWGDPPAKVGDSYVPVPWYTEMIERDYNHPSIFAWSIGNEMHRNRAETREYSAFMVEYIKENLDSSRPVMEVSNTGANNSNDSLQYSEGFVGYNAYGNGSNTAKSLRNRYPDKPIFFTEIGYSQMAENPDDASLNAQGLIDMYRDQPYIFGISLWTLNDYRSHLFGTPVSQNRPWGVITVWGEKKRSYDVLREAFSPVEDLSIRLSGNTEQPGANVVLQVEMQINSADDIPAYPLRNAALKWEAADAEGKIIASGLDELPELQPGAQPYILTGVITVPEGGVRSVRATVIDALGYEVAETWRHCQSPDGLPEITGVAAASGELRVYFNGVDYAC